MRGRFSAADAESTAQVLTILVFALPFTSVYGLVRNAFYSLSDYTTPLYGMVIQLCVIALGCYVLVPRHGVQGLAVASVMAQAAHTLMLGSLLMKRCSAH